MNSVSTILRPHVLLLILLGASLTGCSVSRQARLAAIKTVGDLRSHLEKQDEAQQKAVESLVRQTMEQQRAALRARWALRKEELKIELYAKSDARIRELRKELADDVNKALEPAEQRLKSEIDSESAKGAAGAEKAVTLRLQLASTLAVAQRDVAKAEMQIEEKMLAKRTELFALTDSEFKTMPAGIDGPVTDAELDAVLGDMRKTLKEYRESLAQTTDALSNYLTADEPWKLFLKGLVGDGLYQIIQPRLTEKFNTLQSTVETGLEKSASKLLQYFQSQINSVQKKG